MDPGAPPRGGGGAEPFKATTTKKTGLWPREWGGGGRPLAVKSLNLSTVYTVDGIYSLTITT